MLTFLNAKLCTAAFLVKSESATDSIQIVHIPIDKIERNSLHLPIIVDDAGRPKRVVWCNLKT